MVGTEVQEGSRDNHAQQSSAGAALAGLAGGVASHLGLLCLMQPES